jgi:hypothetical protein
MARFRKKSVIVEADQWFPGKEVDGVIAIESGAIVPYVDRGTHTVSVFPGDWVVREPQGKIYPVKPNRFVEDFEPIGEGFS